MEDTIYVSIKNLSLKYPARRVPEDFKDEKEAETYVSEFAKTSGPWEYEYRIGVERLYVP